MSGERPSDWEQPASTERRPNLVLLITDQQRSADALAERAGLARGADAQRGGAAPHRLSFTDGVHGDAMCSPSRASFLTGTYPSRHGVTLTLTNADLQARTTQPARGAARGRRALARSGRRCRGQRLAGVLRAKAPPAGPERGQRARAAPGEPTLGTRLRDAGYTVVYKGKWHLTRRSAGGHAWGRGGRGEARARLRLRRLGAARRRREHRTRATSAAATRALGGGLGRGLHPPGGGLPRVATDLPEPFCLIVSLVNPHDVLGYPHSFREGGYRREQFADLGVPLPADDRRALAEKPAVHSLMKLGQTSYIGPIAVARGPAATT